MTTGSNHALDLRSSGTLSELAWSEWDDYLAGNTNNSAIRGHGVPLTHSPSMTPGGGGQTASRSLTEQQQQRQPEGTAVPAAAVHSTASPYVLFATH